MLQFLVASDGARANLKRYFDHWGRSVTPLVRIGRYDDADLDVLREGAAIFCDVDTMHGDALAAAKAIWSELADREGLTLLNRPGTALGRRELLRRLHDGGHNSFNVFAVDELDATLRYPVFLRRAADHSGARSPLLHDRPALDRAIAGAVAAGIGREALLVVEFVDTASGGLYRKYSAVKVGHAIIAHHVFHSTEWETKAASLLPPTLESIVEEAEFQLANPHREAVERAFAVAAIDYGRIDYGVRGDRVEVWEINTMPTLLRRPDYYTPAQMHAKRWFAATLNEQFKRLSLGRRGFWKRRARGGRGGR